MRMEFLWLALIVVFAVIEGATTALTTVWFIGGALAALAAALLHAELWQPPCCMPSSGCRSRCSLPCLSYC